MTDIPDDIMKAAWALTNDYRERFDDVRSATNITDVWWVEDRMHAEAIARAIMAERERCARIAVYAAGGYPRREQFVIAGPAGICRNIAQAIRSPDTAGD